MQKVPPGISRELPLRALHGEHMYKAGPRVAVETRVTDKLRGPAGAQRGEGLTRRSAPWRWRGSCSPGWP